MNPRHNLLRRNVLRRNVLRLLAGLALAAAPVLVSPALAQRAPAARNAPTLNAVLAPVFERARLASVQIKTEPEGVGSGFYISDDGFAMTAAHVISGARRFWLLSPDGTRREGKLVGYDEFRDLAIVKADLGGAAGKVPFLELATAAPAPGDGVLAIGNSRGAFIAARPGTVTALERTISETFPKGLLASTMPLAPGDSGGPILNAAGRVVAVAVAIGLDEDGFSSYGAPIFGATALVSELREGARRGVPFIGIELQDAARLTPEAAQLLGLARPTGVFVNRVLEGSGAARAGLRDPKPAREGDKLTALVADIILAVDGRPVRDSDELRALLWTKTVGDTVELTVWRDRQEVKLRLTFGTRITI